MMGQLKNTRSLVTLLLIELACLMGLIFTTAYVLKKQTQASEQLNAAIDLNHTSFQLADQLRHSSDDLTRMVRTYAATGDTTFEAHFYTILNIRNGKVQRPEHYDRIFWDFKVAEGLAFMGKDGEKVSLQDLMHKAGFSDGEFALLAKAQRLSDHLVELEETAMNAMKGRFRDAEGMFTVIKEPDQGSALQILFGKEYHQAKYNIMKPINDFLIASDSRTSNALREAQSESRSLSSMLTFLFCCFAIILPLFILTGHRYHKISQAESRKSEKRYARALEVAKAGTWEWNVEKNEVTWSKEAYDIFDLDPCTPVTYEKIIERVHPDDREYHDRHTKSWLENKGGPPYEYRIVISDRSIRHIQGMGEVVCAPTGEPVLLRGMLQDITERKRVEEEIRIANVALSKAIQKVDESEESYRRLFNLTRDGYVLNKGFSELINPNPAYAEMLGYDMDEILKVSWRDITPQKWLDWELKTHGSQLIERGFTDLYEKESIRKDGTVFPVEVQAYLLNKPEKLEDAFIAAFVRDITERKRAEERIKNQNVLLEKAVQDKQKEMEFLMERLLRQEKLATVGQISGNIAHELRNPLSVINQSIYFLNHLRKTRKLESSDSKVKEHLELVMREIKDSNKVISDLLQLTRREPLEKKQVDLQSVISEVLDRYPLEKMTQLKITFKPEPFMLLADPHQMRQVLLNLLLNATHKITNKRVVTISAEMLKKNKKCLIKIHDDGPGIADKNLSKVFEPLYTTKAKGIGLGLNICKQIIENHGGSISVTSETGKGTTVKIELPYETLSED